MNLTSGARSEGHLLPAIFHRVDPVVEEMPSKTVFHELLTFASDAPERFPPASFVAEHVDKFSYEDENKLEYTEIHQRFGTNP